MAAYHQDQGALSRRAMRRAAVLLEYSTLPSKSKIESVSRGTWYSALILVPVSLCREANLNCC